jgi:hypothetical protein
MTNNLLVRLRAAKGEISDAETELGTALREIRIAPRAEKTAITAVIEDALKKVRSARATVAELEELLSPESK